MAHEEKLPWELIEEILSRVPPRSLVRFRIVSKQWNSLFNDKTFINNHKTTFRFILATKSKIYSVSINPEIETRELTLDIPGLESKMPKRLIDFNGSMLCGMDKETLVWNPWLKQTRRIKLHVDRFTGVSGIGYDDVNKSYKILGFCNETNSTKTNWKIGDFDSYMWQSVDSLKYDGEKPISFHPRSVMLDGNLYWVGSYKNSSMFCLLQFDFSIEKLYKYCELSCGENHDHDDALLLDVYKGDRLSLLKQCHVSKKIEIWVTKNKIRKLCGRGRDVEWMNIMEISIPNLPYLKIESRSPPSYFIDDDDKRLVVCSCDETGRAWIYVFGHKKLISKTKLDLVVDLWPLHRTFFPSLVEVTRGQIVKSWKEVLLGSLRR